MLAFMEDAAIQTIGWPEFEDGVWMGVLQEKSLSPEFAPEFVPRVRPQSSSPEFVSRVRPQSSSLGV